MICRSGENFISHAEFDKTLYYISKLIARPTLHRAISNADEGALMNMSENISLSRQFASYSNVRKVLSNCEMLFPEKKSRLDSFLFNDTFLSQSRKLRSRIAFSSSVTAAFLRIILCDRKNADKIFNWDKAVDE